MNVQNRQYRASRMRGDGQDLRRGKEGWFGREGQSPGPSMTVTHLTQVGVIIRLGNDRRMTLIDPDGPQTHIVSQPWGASLRLKKNRRDRAIPDRDSVVVEQNSNLDLIWRTERDGSHRAPLGRNVSAPRRGMRLAGISGPARSVAPARGNDVKGRSAVRPLSVEVVELSPALVPVNNLISGRKTMSSGAGGIAPAVVADPCADSGRGDVLGSSGGSRVGLCERG